MQEINVHLVMQGDYDDGRKECVLCATTTAHTNELPNLQMRCGW